MTVRLTLVDSLTAVEGLRSQVLQLSILETDITTVKLLVVLSSPRIQEWPATVAPPYGLLQRTTRSSIISCRSPSQKPSQVTAFQWIQSWPGSATTFYSNLEKMHQVVQVSLLSERFSKYGRSIGARRCPKSQTKLAAQLQRTNR